MILSLSPSFADDDIPSHVVCGLSQYLQEKWLADVVRAGARKQKSARF